MDHHLSWYHYLPGYEALHNHFQTYYAHTVLFNGGILPEVGVFNTIHHMVAGLIVVAILCIMAIMAKMRLKNLEAVIIPSPKFSLLNFFELIMQVLMNLMKDIIGADYKRHVPLVGTLALFILMSNLLGLVPGFVPPTDNLNTTLACGLVVFFYFNAQGIRVHGLGHITHLANPLGEWWGWFLSPLLFPVELIGLLVRPFSLGIRLAGNMIGDHKVLLAFAGILPFLVPLPFFFLGLLVSVIQTIVFCLLTCVYISLHTQEAEH
ncbi:F0F1 ATP synthase subunit A [Sulfobacillus acidophilus]|uniref:ATP synthase subunit a n=1 Tax=Sulfobacillus acidophilus TaxID=53633 RepID=A0ABS3AZ85_9FIRM|nr:F0F1 ATP synthase subunit A [Sulfobacillus acidophilus]